MVVMSKRLWMIAVAGTLVAALLLPSVPVVAQMYNPDEDLPKPTGVEKSLTKLGRGLSNIFYGWAEIPLTFDRDLKKGKPFAHLFAVSPVLGMARALIRTGTGVFEVVSFPYSDKSVNYEPILEPEYIF